MEVKPVKQTEKPRYPLKAEFNEEELKEQIPKRWMKTPAAKVALGTLAVVTLSGCYTPGGADVIPSMVTEGSIETTQTSVIPEGTPSVTGGKLPFDLQNYIIDGGPIGKTMICKLNVAPLFLHGEGRGSCGCAMIAPPVFLSEEEALVVINEIAMEYGLEFSSEGTPEFNNVLQPQTNLFPLEDEFPDHSTKSPDKLITLKTDFVESGHNIIIEYVSTEDVISWGKPSDASVEVYETKDVADQLSDSLEQAAGLGYTAGVLYDPCSQVEPEDWSDRKKWEEAEAKAQGISEEQLKAQAKDFFEWLKGQGVI